MPKLLPHILIALILALATTACRRTAPAALSAIERADSLIDSRPDSALTLLQQIDPARLGPRADRARYALLLTMALDKNWLAPANDSLIATATDFYERGNDPLSQTMAEYYHGRVNFNAGNLTSAMTRLYRAKELAEANGLDFWAGMACRGIADIYAETFNYAEQLEFARLELHYLQRSGHQPHLNYAFIDLGNALVNYDLYDDARAMVKQAADSAKSSADQYLHSLSLRLQAVNAIKQNDHLSARLNLEELCQTGFATNTDSLFLVQCYAYLNNTSTASQLLKKVSDGDDAINNAYALYAIALNNGDFTTAMTHYQKCDSISSDILRKSMSHKLTTSLAEYYQLNKALNETRLKHSRNVLWLSLTLAVLAIVLVIWGAVETRNKQLRIINNKVVFANRLQMELEASKARNKSDAITIREFASFNNELLNEFSEIVTHSADTKTARRKIADTVTSLINQLSVNGEEVKKLEKRVDKLYNNLYTDFCNDFPDLKDADYKLFLFSALNMSLSTIALVLKESNISSIYNRKRRLKDKLKKISDKEDSRYLQYLQ